MSGSLRGSSSRGAATVRHSRRIAQQPPEYPNGRDLRDAPPEAADDLPDQLEPPPSPSDTDDLSDQLEPPSSPSDTDSADSLPDPPPPPQAPPAIRAVPAVVRNLHLQPALPEVQYSPPKMASASPPVEPRSFTGDSAFKAEEYCRAVTDKLEQILRVNGTTRHAFPIKQQLDVLGSGLPQQAETGRWQDLISEIGRASCRERVYGLV